MKAWEIARKDLSLLIKDRRAFFLLLVFPLLFISIIGYSTAQIFSDGNPSRMLHIVVVQEDEGELTESFLEELNSIRGLSIHQEGESIPKEAQSGQARPVKLVIEKGFTSPIPPFSEDVGSAKTRWDLDDLFDEQTSAAHRLKTLHLRIEDPPFLPWAYSLLRETVIASAIRSHWNSHYKLSLPVEEHNDADASKSRGSQPDDFTTAKGSEDDDHYVMSVYQEVVPSYTVLFVFFLINIMARSFLQERDTGTLSRLRLAPITNAGILWGKTLPFFILSIIQIVLLFLCGKLFYGMSWGVTPLMLIPIILGTSLSAACLGLVVATLVKTDSQVSAYANVLIMGMAGISGCFVPRDWLPEILQKISLLTPHAWSLIGFKELLTSSAPRYGTVLLCFGMLLWFSGLYYVLGMFFSRKMFQEE